jgi:RNA polymerase sigma-70 factor (ECF subfamily)
VPASSNPSDPGVSRGGLRAVGDEAVVAAALSGAPEACEEIVRRFERPIFSLIVRMVRDQGHAEDLTQDTFLKMFRALGRYDPTLRFSSWLFRIAHNTAIDFLRKRRLLVVEPIEDSDGDQHDPLDTLPDPDAISPERAAVRSELTVAVEQALDRLRPDYRAVLVLRYQEGLEYQEIADVLQTPLGTVKTFLHRARRLLAHELAQAGWASETRPVGGP